MTVINVVEDMKEDIGRQLKKTDTTKDNLTFKQKQALKNLTTDDTITINKADKGSTIVIQDKELYIQSGLEHLKDESTYTELPVDPTPTLIQNINSALKEMKKSRQLTNKQLTFLKPPTEADTTHLLLEENTQNPNVRQTHCKQL